MIKKIFALLLSATVILLASSVYAASEVTGSMDKAGSSVENVINGAGDVVRDGAEAIGDGVRDLGDGLTSGDSDMMGDMTGSGTTDGGYTATRTSADANGTILGMSPNTFTWFVLAIAAIVIVGLVWYYAAQNKNEYNNNTHND